MLFVLLLAVFKPVSSGEVFSEKGVLPVLSPKGSYVQEDFENWPPATFTLNPSSGSGAWLQSPVNSASYISPQTGANGSAHGAEFDCWSYYAGISGEMISVPVDLSGSTNPTLEFYFWNHTDQTGYGNNDSTIVSISTDNGNTWTTLAVMKGNVDDWTLHTYDLSSYIGDTIMIKFTGVSDYGGSNMGIDEVVIGEKPSVDAGVSSIVSPDYYEDPSSSVTPACVTASVGSDTVYNVYYHCVVESLGNIVYSESILVHTLYAGLNDTVSFPAFTPTQGFYYTFTFYSALSGDVVPTNDTLSRFTKFYSTERFVVGELGTNTSCGPCKPANDTLDQIFPDYPNRLGLIRYHAWWPSSSDPFYTYNIPENTTRIRYYGINYVPHIFFDGDVDGEYNYESWRNMILAEMDKGAPLSISLSGIYDTTSAAGTLYVNIEATGEPVEGNLYLRCCLVENNINYNAPNGQTVFYQVFRRMFPDTIGVNIGTLHRGDTRSDHIPFTIDTGNFNEDNLEFVVFVQSDDNKHILQGGKIKLTDIPTGIATSSENELRFVSLPHILAGEMVAKIYTPYGDNIKIKLLDISGRIVYTRDMVTKGKGVYTVRLKDTDIGSGIYFISVEAGEKTIMGRAVLLK